ncbi:MAG TPA: HlyD family secretion protein, partial [Burkholderiales bacterium]|nr:HlyD family secretion protein [Burkholderiales bacterium]
VTYHGVVAGMSGGTGSTFAAIPAQNATGNWIKVVQRVPVRIALDPAELAKYPLQLGLSMEAEVDTHSRDGERLPRVSRPAADTQPGNQSQGDSALMAQAAQRVAAIIKANR